MDAEAFVKENKEKMLALSAMCQEVGRELKRGLKEAHYQAALCRELQMAHIEYVSEESMPIFYKGVPLGGNLSMRLDICIPAFPMIVELKAEARMGAVQSGACAIAIEFKRVRAQSPSGRGPITTIVVLK